MTEHFTQNFVNHRHIGFATQTVAELSLHHRERGFNVGFPERAQKGSREFALAVSLRTGTNPERTNEKGYNQREFSGGCEARTRKCPQDTVDFKSAPLPIRVNPPLNSLLGTKLGATGGVRTLNSRLSRPTFYQLNYRRHSGASAHHGCPKLFKNSRQFCQSIPSNPLCPRVPLISQPVPFTSMRGRN